MVPPLVSPVFNSPVDVFTLVNTITGGIFGVGTLIAIFLIILFSLFDNFKERALLAASTVVVVLSIFFAWLQWVSAYVVLFWCVIMAIAIILNTRFKSGNG